MLPFLGFTSGNVSRYAYLPAAGFSLAIAALVVLGVDAVSRSRVARLAPIVLALATLFVAVRFGNFFVASMKSQVLWMEEWRAHSMSVAERTAVSPDGTVRPPARAATGDFPAMYDVPMLQWMRRNDGLRAERP
jgi:hypothetical protein